MLKEFRVDNFKSLINVQFRPKEMNLIVGLNNTGKTNLCQALLFLVQSVFSPLNDCANRIAGLPSFLKNSAFNKSEIEFELTATIPFRNPPSREYTEGDYTFNYYLSISAPRTIGPDEALLVEEERLTVMGDKFPDVTLLHNTRDGVKLLHETDFIKGQAHEKDTSAPRDTTMLNRLYDLKANALANCFKRYIASWAYYDLSPEKLRGFNYEPNQVVLSSDGSNLSSVLYRLKTSDEHKYRKYLAYAKEFDASIDAINFQLSSDKYVFMVIIDEKGTGVIPQNISNGTLRYLAMLYIFLAQSDYGVSSVIILEEPENGIYVGKLKRLIEFAADSPNSPQIVFTSHSPYFIDLFDKWLDGLFLMRKTEAHSYLTQPDVEIIRAKLADGPLGELFFQDLL